MRPFPRHGTSSPRITRPVVAAALGVALFAASTDARAQKYAAQGPSAVTTKRFDGASVGVVVVQPTSGTPAPLIVASHGFLGSGDNQIGWARHFASYGFVVAVPSFGGGLSPNHAKNAQVIADIVGDLTGADAAKFGVAPGPFGLEGHSAGGLATTLAAKQVNPAAAVLFDPVDDDASSGKAAYASLCSPVFSLFAEAGACNKQSAWKAFANATTAEMVGVDVDGSTHCDGENTTRGLCGIGCGGGSDVDRQRVYAHYATAFFLAKLKNDATAAQSLTATAISGDTAVTPSFRKASTCSTSTTPDAGASSSSGGTSSSSGGTSSSSGGASTSSSGAVTEASPTEPGDETEASVPADDAGGCAMTSGGTTPAGAMGTVATAALALVLTRRRRR